MSMSTVLVRCDGCDFEGVIQRRSVTLEYVLPNGIVVEGYRVAAWCSSCNKITDSEEKFDADTIQAEINSYDHKRVGFLSRLFGSGNAEDEEFKHLNSKLELALIRRSKPRCLSCGSPTTVELNFDQDGASNVLHACGSRLFRLPEDQGAPRFMYIPEVIRLDSEGLRI